MRLIDAEDILVGWQRTGMKEYDEGKEVGIDLVLAIIDHLPTIEAKPIVHAHWEKQNYIDMYYTEVHCSSCGKRILAEHQKEYKYCPHCGAQMDELVSKTDELNSSVKIPVISIEDVTKMLEKELPSLEENPILRTIREIEKESD